MFDGITVASIVSTATPFVTALVGIALVVIAYRVTLRLVNFAIAKFSK